MKTLFFYLIIVLSSLSINAQWVKISELALPLEYPDIKDMKIVNSNTIYLGGYKFFFKSEDGGVTWQTISSIPTGINNSEVISIEAVNENNVFIQVVYSENSLTRRAIFNTTDGGNTWNNVLTNSFNTTITDNMLINQIQVVNETNVLAVGALFDQPNGQESFIIKSTDSGNSWTRIVLDDSVINGNTEFPTILSVKFINSNEGFIITRSGLWKTTNSGTSWNKFITPSEDNPPVYVDYSENTLFLYYLYPPLSVPYKLIKTNDNGATWLGVNYDPFWMFNHPRPQIINSQSILIINTAATYITKTEDGGINWSVVSIESITTALNLNDGDYLNALSFFNNELGFLILGNNVLKTTNGNITTNIENEETIPTDFILEQNYPNPFNPSTEIRYQIAEESKVSLKVFDILGNEIAVLVSDIQNAGKYNINFNNSDLSSGVYLYKLQAISSSGKTNFSSTKKMILQK